MASGGVIRENNSGSTHNYPRPVNGILHVRYDSNSVRRANHPICRANSVDDHRSIQVILLGQKKFLYKWRMPLRIGPDTGRNPWSGLPSSNANYCSQSADDVSALITKATS
jgi:hypothetical protein